MSMQSIEQIHRRIAKLAMTCASAATGQSHLAAAMTHATSARADLTVIQDLNTAHAAITRVIKRAELQRQRLLRKANRQGATP